MEKDEKSKTKVDFIKDLLNDKRIDNTSKDKLFSLVAKDFGKFDDEIEAIHKEINKIKELIITDDIQPSSLLPIIHEPKKFVELLKNFSKNGTSLKYATHSWDMGKDSGIFNDIESFLFRATEEYKKFSFELKRLKNETNAKIYQFLINSNVSKQGWGEFKGKDSKIRIQFGWSSPELIRACKEKNDLNPEDFMLPLEYQFKYKEKSIQKFKQIIDLFKNEIEVREDNLFKIFDEKHYDYLSVDFEEPIFNNFEHKSFYTDVQWFKKALNLIFEAIQKRPQYPRVEYRVIDNTDQSMSIYITHKDSYCTGRSIEDPKFNLSTGDFSSIKEILFNLCDWSIESNFKEGNYRINLLSSNSSITHYERIENCAGFVHVLKFYK